jgi:Na+/proline symporter
MRTVDLVIVVAYNLGVVLLGCWFVRRTRSAERFMSAGKALPGWAVGSIMSRLRAPASKEPASVERTL